MDIINTQPGFQFFRQKLLAILALFLIQASLISCNTGLFQKKYPHQEVWSKEDRPTPFEKLKSLPAETIQKLKDRKDQSQVIRNPKAVSAIIVHITGDLSAETYIQKSLDSSWMVHLIITREGKLLGENAPGNYLYPAAPGMDPESIHVSIEGTESQILNNEKQLEAATRAIETLSKSFGIALSNRNIESKQGVFSHIHSKMRYGGFVSLFERNSEKVLKNILTGAGGEYFPEHQWEGRFESHWVYRRENPDVIKKREPHNRGPGLSQNPVRELPIFEADPEGIIPDRYRLHYVDRGSIDPTCVVLHYTAIRSFPITLQVLSERRLAAQIVVDQNGKIFQVMDHLTDKAAAAAGTNDHCIQVEITGKNTADLMQNETQTRAVVQMLGALSEKYNIPLNNYDIEGFQGIFSHTQAKKKWGKSIFLTGDDYDPGEPYMKKVIEMAGGKYYKEPEWKDRKGDLWAILYRDFQP